MAAQPSAQLLTDRWPKAWLSRVEDVGINASAPPQQRWIDGWLVRYSAGKAKRARCVQAVSEGVLPLDVRLAECAAVFSAHGLPLMLRITPFSQPAGLDAALAERSFRVLDDTRVMVLDLPGTAASRTTPASAQQTHPLLDTADLCPPHLQPTATAAVDYAEAVGALRGSPAQHRTAHAQRLLQSPVPYQGWTLRHDAQSPVLCCAQTAREGDMLGLYDVFTAPSARGQGLARQLCRQLLLQAAAEGARTAYLQVDANNVPARQIYRRLGFADAYSYHYRTLDPTAD